MDEEIVDGLYRIADAINPRAVPYEDPRGGGEVSCTVSAMIAISHGLWAIADALERIGSRMPDPE